MKEKGFIYKHKSIIILSLIILIGMIKLIYLFSLRDGHHVDETWSYGYANSFFMPHVFGGYYDYEIRNLGEWVKGEEFKDYITVSYDERFRFDSVMYKISFLINSSIKSFLNSGTVCNENNLRESNISIIRILFFSFLAIFKLFLCSIIISLFIISVFVFQSSSNNI